MKKCVTTIMKVVIHRENANPVFGEGNTYVSIDDEGGGPFVVLEQHDGDINPGTIRIDYDEFLEVAEAAKMLMHQTHIEKPNLDTL